MENGKTGYSSISNNRPSGLNIVYLAIGSGDGVCLYFKPQQVAFQMA